VSVPAATLLSPEDQTFVAPEVAKCRFAAVGADRAERVIAYCGGGISATVDLFLLHQLGHEALSLYDASMGEWAKDESLPIERG
jgi:thiosulfate/3-mercaptopyruvate sulfurtransferase